MTRYDVLCVGIPKSGTNMTERVCRLLGVSPSPHMHTANYHLAEDNKVAYVYRNPRNVLVSAVRYRNEQRRGWTLDVTQDKLVDVAFDFFNAPIWAVYGGYAKWLTSSAYCFKYEDMVAGKAADGLADYLGVARRGDIAALLADGGTATWTGAPSRWEDVWGEEIDRVWHEEGMVEIECGLGYGG